MTEFAEGLKESIEVITPYIKDLSNIVGENGSYVFSLYVKQSYIEGLSYLFVLFLSIVFLLFSYLLYIKDMKIINEIKNSEDYKKAYSKAIASDDVKKNIEEMNEIFIDSESSDMFILSFLLAVLGISLFVIFSINIQTVIGDFINPEYHAIQTLLHQLPKK